MKKTLLRFVSMVMAVAMLVCSANLTVFATGSSSEGVDIITAILESDTWKDELEYEELDVLNVDAFNFDIKLNLNKPKSNDSAVTVSFEGANDYIVETLPISSGLDSGAEWIATEAVVTGTSGTLEISSISGTETNFKYDGTIENVEVTYSLTFTDLTKEQIKTVLDLPNKLVAEVKEQTRILDLLKDNAEDIKLVQNTIVLAVLNQYFPEQTARLKSECMVEVSGKYELILLNHINAYKEQELIYYYTGNNSDEIIDELIKLSLIVEEIAKGDDFDSLVADIEESFGSSVADQVRKVKSVSDDLADYRDDLKKVRVNENIDRDSDNLQTLLDAVAVADGLTSEHVVANNNIEYTEKVNAAAPGKALITVKVEVKGKNESYTQSYSLDEKDTINEKHRTDLAGILEKLQEEVKSDVTHYDFVGSLPDIGTKVKDITDAITFSYVPREYTVTVKIEGIETNQSVTVDNASIKLPRPAAGHKYIYDIAGQEVEVFPAVGSDYYTYTFTNLKVFKDGPLTINGISKEYTKPVDQSELLSLVDKINAAFAAGNLDAVMIPVEDAEHNISLILRVSPELTGIQMEAVGMELIKVLMSTEAVSIGGSALYDGQIHLQAIFDFMASSGFGFNAFCNVVGADGRVKNDTALSNLKPVGAAVSGGFGGKLMESTLGLTSGDATSEYNFYVTLQDGVATDTLAKTRELIAQLKGYINIECSNGAFNVTLNSPDSVYPYYLMAMLVLDKAELYDPNDMDLKECIEYEFSLIKPLILDDNFTVETLENTLAKAGQNYDLSQYATEFDYVRKLFKVIIKENATVETSSTANVYSVSAQTKSSGIINRLLAKFDMGTLGATAFAESAEGSTVDFNFTVTLADMNNEYDALVFDYSKSGLKKFTGTYDLAATLNSVGENAVIVLVNDVTLSGPVNIKNRTFINLNGYTITGDMKASAAVRITNANLEADKGGVNGKLTGDFTLTGGKYTANVDALLATGYSVDANGYVVNDVYTVVKNGDKVEVALNADFLYDYSSVSSSKKDFLVETAVDVAFDIALNMYTAAAMEINDNTIYDFSTITDVVGLLDNTKNQLANKAIKIVNVNGLSKTVNAIAATLCDFKALEEAINSNAPVASYEITTRSWGITPYVETNGNYLTVRITPSEESETTTLNIVVSGTDANKKALADICGKLKDVVKVNVAEIIVNDVSYNGGFTADYSAAADITVDLSSDNDYAALVAAAVAYKLPAGAQKEAIVEALKVYFDNGGTEKLVAVLENVSAAQVIAAIKGLGNETCENMLTSLGFTSDSVVALEAVYGTMIDLAAKVLAKLDITGPATTLAGFKVDGEFAKYNWTKDNIKGYNVDVALTLILASDKPAESPVEIGAPTVDLSSAEVNALIRGFYYDNKVNDVYLDAKCMGITVDQLLTYVKINIDNATLEEIYVVDRNGNKCAGDALVGTGYSVVVTASNSVSSETLTIRVIISGDVNRNGKVDSGDAAMMARHYLELELLNEDQKLAADNNRNGTVDSGDAARIAAKYTYTWDDNTYESFYKAS